MHLSRPLLIALALLAPNAIAQEGGPGSPGTGGVVPSLSISFSILFLNYSLEFPL